MGPSKEELEKYFKNNRKYFDELANIYRQTDPEFYEKNIAPFYASQFSRIEGGKSVRPQIALLIASFSVFILGFVLFFIFNQSNMSDDYDDDEDDIENYTESNNTVALDTLTNFKGLSDYEKGMLYFQLEEYDKAEKLLSGIPESDSKYNEAKLRLVEIKKKKSENKK